MLNDLNQKSELQKQLEDDLSNCNEEIARNQTIRDDIQRELISLGAGGGSIKSVEDIVREEGENECLRQLSKAIRKFTN